MPSVSLIVTIYNSERYLSDCLNSIKDQQFTDFECLLVDDGSSDNSATICQRYYSSDNRFKYYYRPHTGVASARAFALSQVKGEFICWLDSDDIITSSYINDLYSDISSTRCDLVIHGYMSLREGNTEALLPIKGHRLFSIPDHYDSLFQEVNISLIGHSFSKMFRHAIIQENALKYCRQMIVAEDLDFLLRYIPHCQSILVRDKTNYIYRNNPFSVSSCLYSYQQELSGLLQLSSSWQELAMALSVDSDSFVRQAKHSVSAYVHRVVCSCYKCQLTHRERLKYLQDIPAQLLDVYGEHFRPTVFLTCLSWLFSKRLFRIADFLSYCIL